MRRNCYSATLVILFLTGCERVEYYPDRPVENITTRVLAHKGGGGAFGEGNSFEACVYGLSKADGIEVDIQIGEDNTLWLSHSSDVPACGSFKGSCFASLQYQTIADIDSCLGPLVNFTTLEHLFQYVSTNHPEKHLSLDVKAWSPCEIGGLNVSRRMNEMASQIITLTGQYGLQNRVMVESETGDFLYYVKKNCNYIETYLTTLSDFELGAARAIDAGFTGISYQFNVKEKIIQEQVDLLHRKGLKIQLWTIYGEEDFNEALALGVDYIQTDNL